ncbi:unnamed protein product [Malus baccata var. baccata]
MQRRQKRVPGAVPKISSSTGSQPLKKVEVVAAAAAEKKLVVSKRAKTAVQAVLSKRPRQEVEQAIEAPQPAKRVKKLAKKGERVIHVISSQTTGATTPSVSPSPPIIQALVEKRSITAEEIVQVRPVSKVGEPVVVLPVEAAPVPEEAVLVTEVTYPKNPKPSAFVLEESDGNDEVPLASRFRPRRQPPPVSEVAVQVSLTMIDRGKRSTGELKTAAETPVPPPVSEEAVQVGPSTTDHGKRPVGEPEATAERPFICRTRTSIFLRRKPFRPLTLNQENTKCQVPVHSFHRKFYAPKGVIYISWPPPWPSNIDNLHRPRELRSNLRYWARPLSSLGSINDPEDMAEVSSRHASWEVEFKVLLSSTVGAARPSVPTTDPADSTALVRV